MTDQQRSYRVILEGKDRTELRPFIAIEDLRPRVGDQIKLVDFPLEIFKITRTEPSGAPVGANVIYIVEPQSQIEKIAGGPVPNFPEHFLSL